MASSSAGRQQFISSAIKYAHKYGFDGIDIDWEYPGDRNRGGTDNDFDNFLALLKEFRSAINNDAAGQKLLLTIASPAIKKGEAKNPQQFFEWLAQCAEYLDWMNVMSYDYHGAFPDDKVTGVNAPLLQDSTPGGNFSIKDTVEAYLAAKIPKDKIVLGMPTYGRTFKVTSPFTDTDNGHGKPYSGAGSPGQATQTPGFLAYYEILEGLSSGDWKRGWDKTTLTPYAYNSKTGEWVSYDDAESLAYKVSYLIEEGLAGAMVWAIDDDDFSNGFPLIKKIKDILENPETRPDLPGDSSFGKPDWMSNLPNNIKISRLTIPGTHDTCTYTLSPSYVLTPITKCQDRTLEDQSYSGIRFIDIRCRHINNEFAIHHGRVYLNLNFDKVRDVCIDFLKRNPSECIVMSVKHEYDDGEGITRSYEATFDSYLQGSQELWYFGDTIPRLGDVRGKIVLFRRFELDNRPNRTETKGIDASSWPDNATFDISVNSGTLKIQDEYKVTITTPSLPDHIDVDSKWERIKSLLERAKSDPTDTWYINFTSGSSLFGYPNAVAGRINYRVYDYIGYSKFPNRLGTVVMDFPDDNMIRRIIHLNK